MSKIQTQAQIDDIKDPEERHTQSAIIIGEIVSKVNGQLEFDKNLLTQTIEVVFTASNTEQKINHSLNKLVYNYFIVSKLAACDVYDGGTDPTSNAIYLKSTVATAVTLILF